MTRRAIGYLVLAGLVLTLAVFGPAACNAYLAEKQAGKIARGQTEATLDTVDAANEKAAEIDRLEQAIERETKDLADEVRNATAGDSNDIADRSVCRSAAYRDTERCAAMRAADSGIAP